MRQLSVIVLIALIAVASAQQNCSMLPVPATNMYNIPRGCQNETSYKACNSSYHTCLTANANTCPSMCATQMLRCIEAAAPGFTTCDSTFAGAFSNEKLYLAAGGDYNGSALQQSCAQAICGWMQNDGAKCVKDGSVEKMICADPMFGATTVAPVATAAPTVDPNPGTKYTTGSFKFQGSVAEWTAVFEKLGGKANVIAQIVGPMLDLLLGKGTYVIVDIAIGSLKVDFYMTDGSDATQVSEKLKKDVSNDPEFQKIRDVAVAAGMSAENFKVDTTSIAVENAKPAASASAVAVLAAIMAVVALVF